MKATNVLMEEHRVIERMLVALETNANRLEAAEPVRPEFFLDVTAFVKGFADGCHHKKEEGVLFPAMQSHGIPVQGGPISVMLQEHEMGRAFNRGLLEATLRLQGGDESARSLVVQNARGYIDLLRQHIFKEDNILFLLADRVIPATDQDLVWEGFEHVEHEETGQGIHEKYLALVEALEQEVSAGG